MPAGTCLALVTLIVFIKKSSNRRKALVAILSLTLQLSPHWAMAQADPADKRAQLLDWAYNNTHGRLDLEEDASQAVADFLVRVPDAQLDDLKKAIAALVAARGKNLDTVQKIISDVTQAQKTAGGVQALLARQQAHDSQSDYYAKLYDWAYNNHNGRLNLDDDVARVVADFLVKYPEDKVDDLKKAIAALLPNRGTDQAAVQALLRDVWSAEKVPNGLQSLTAKAANDTQLLTLNTELYKWAYNRAGGGLDLDEKPAQDVADFIMRYPVASREDIKKTLSMLVDIHGGELAQVTAILSELRTALQTPEGFKAYQTQLADGPGRKVILDKWALNSMHLAPEDATALVTAMIGLSADQSFALKRVIDDAKRQDEDGFKAALHAKIAAGPLDVLRFGDYTDWAVTSDAAGGKIASGCASRNRVDASYSQALPSQTCVDQLGIRYLWVDTALKNCGMFTNDFVFVQDAKADQCDSHLSFCADREDGVLTEVSRNALGQIMLKVIPNTTADKDNALGGSCTESSGPILANNSPSKAYFEDLLKRGMSAPLTDFLKLWYPKKGDGHDKESPLFKCEQQEWGALQPGADGLIPKNCAPDVLYSWGPPQKVTSISQHTPDGAEWSGSPNIGIGVYSLPSAIGSYAYGLVPIRFKLKPQARIRNVGGNVAPHAGEVTYNPWQQIGDFVISDSSAVESWSYGTPELYDEIVRDSLRLISGKRSIVYAMQPTGNGLDRLTGLEAFDGHVGGENTLKAEFLEMIRMILNGEGKIFYSKGACRNRAKFFATDKHSYINP